MWFAARADDIVPIAVEAISFNLERPELFGRDLPADWVVSTIEGGSDNESHSRRGVPDEVDHRLVATQRPAAPVHGDEGKEAMLDLVPLAGAAGIGGDEDLLRIRVAL